MSTYESQYTGLEVDSSVGSRPVCMTAAQLANASSTVGFGEEKIIIVVSGNSSSQNNADYPVNSLWHRVGNQVERLAVSDEYGFWYANISTSGASTTEIIRSTGIFTYGYPELYDLILSNTGDVYQVSNIDIINNSFIVSFKFNIRGTSGTKWFSGSDVIHVDGAGGAYVIPLATVPTIALGDYYLSTTTYVSDGYTIGAGDTWMVNTMSSTHAILSKIMTLQGGSDLPPVTPADAGKFAVVDSNGEWAAISIAQWQGGTY